MVVTQHQNSLGAYAPCCMSNEFPSDADIHDPLIRLLRVVYPGCALKSPRAGVLLQTHYLGFLWTNLVRTSVGFQAIPVIPTFYQGRLCLPLPPFPVLLCHTILWGDHMSGSVPQTFALQGLSFLPPGGKLGDLTQDSGSQERGKVRFERFGGSRNNST